CSHHLSYQRRLAQRADDFIVIAMADENDGIGLAGVLDRFNVDFSNQRAGGINHAKIAFLAGLANLWRNAVGAVDDALTWGDLFHAIYEHRSFGGKFIYHVAVVNNLLAHVDRRAKGIERDFYDVNCPDYAGAKAPRLKQKQCFGLVQ